MTAAREARTPSRASPAPMSTRSRMLVISGHVRTQIMADHSFQRQVGPQELNHEPMAKPVCKYTTTVMKAEDIRYETEKCIHLAMSGRPGPTWLNIPLDIQNAMIEPEELREYTPEESTIPKLSDAELDRIAAMIAKAERPIIMGGNGIVPPARARVPRSRERLQIPVLLTISGWTSSARTSRCSRAAAVLAGNGAPTSRSRIPIW